MSNNHDPLQPHSHEPNPEPPSADPSFELILPDGRSQAITVSELEKLPETAVANCYIVSTGHGTTGPFTFSGVTLREFMQMYVRDAWSQAEVISTDGFGNRVFAEELVQPNTAGPIILAYKVNGRPLTRQEGLVRMIVPGERDDALRQGEGGGRIRIRP